MQSPGELRQWPAWLTIVIDGIDAAPERQGRPTISPLESEPIA
jgi:hypothetical protein